MRRAVLIGLVALPSLAAGSAPALAGSPSVGTSGNTFVPPETTVDTGSTVTIANTGGGNHNLIWDDGTMGFPTASTSMWTSSRMFPTAGDFRFYCAVHGGPSGVGMAGVVRVVAPPAPPPPRPPAPPPPDGAVPPPPVPPADTAAPRLTRVLARANRRTGLTLRVTLNEAARVTVVVQRRRRTVVRRIFRDVQPGASTLRVRSRRLRGRLTVRVRATDGAGNTARRTLRVRVR